MRVYILLELMLSADVEMASVYPCGVKMYGLLTDDAEVFYGYLE